MADWLAPLPQLLEGAQITAIVWFLGSLLSMMLALIGGIGRLSNRRWVRMLAGTYIEALRGTSVVVQMFWLFFALPIVLDVELSPLLAGVVALGMNVGAYGSEVVRGAIQAVPQGQWEAGTALGFSPTQQLRRIVLPQAVPMMLPPFGNLLIELLKGTALVSLITVTDLTQAAQIIRARTGETVQLYTTILIMYFLMAGAITVLMRRVESWAAIGDTGDAVEAVRDELPEPAV